MSSSCKRLTARLFGLSAICFGGFWTVFVFLNRSGNFFVKNIQKIQNIYVKAREKTTKDIENLEKVKSQDKYLRRFFFILMY